MTPSGNSFPNFRKQYSTDLRCPDPARSKGLTRRLPVSTFVKENVFWIFREPLRSFPYECFPRMQSPPPQPRRQQQGALAAVGLDRARITGGFWAPRQTRNGEGAIPTGQDQLEAAGNLHNLRLAAGVGEGEAIGPVFADSDVYKWLEAAAWEYGRNPNEDLLKRQRELTCGRRRRAARGWLPRLGRPARDGDEGRYKHLVWSHEHYCAGHLMQAAVAQVRCTGDRELLDVAIKLADHLVATFGDGAGQTVDVDGHPVIEMALVELYRETGTTATSTWPGGSSRPAATASSRNTADPTCFSDLVPVREATTVEGHAVRAVYLAAGATDVALETADAELLEALKTQFEHMWSTKTYLHRRPRRALGGRGVRRRVRAADGPRVRRNLCGDRWDPVGLADAARHR